MSWDERVEAGYTELLSVYSGTMASFELRCWTSHAAAGVHVVSSAITACRVSSPAARAHQLVVPQQNGIDL